VAELRLILLGCALAVLALIWWWTARNSRQGRGSASGAARADEPVSSPPLAGAAAVKLAAQSAAAEGVDWGVSPLEPLSIKTADFNRVPILEMPMMSTPKAPQAKPASAPPPPPATPAARTDDSVRFAPVEPRSPNASERQRIVTVRVCAVAPKVWSGTQLIAALESQGLAYGKYKVYHRPDVDGRSLFCVASLIEPGTFDIELMPHQEFRGLTLFAVLPGPAAPLQTIDALLTTARGLAEKLAAMVQDAQGLPLSPLRAAALREDVARFQAQLA
jgi:cell division protein ZipA